MATVEPQNTGPNVDDLQSRIAKMLLNKKCADFIRNLINGAAAKTGNAAVSTNPNDLLKLINSNDQKGFAYANNTPVLGSPGGTVNGNISNHSAQVVLQTPYPNYVNAPGFAESQARIEAMAALHEIIHLAGQEQYSDQILADVRRKMAGAPSPSTDITTREGASQYWNHGLEAACKPRN